MKRIILAILFIFLLASMVSVFAQEGDDDLQLDDVFNDLPVAPPEPAIPTKKVEQKKVKAQPVLEKNSQCRCQCIDAPNQRIAPTQFFKGRVGPSGICQCDCLRKTCD